jgi:WD40 repeat protein
MWRVFGDVPKRPDGRDYGANVYMAARTPAPADTGGPFAVLRRGSQAGGQFPTLAAAVAGAGSGDTIEVRGDGPFLCDPIEAGTKDLVIRAGSGFRPRLQFTSAEKAPNRFCLQSNGRLVLEGLELFHRVTPPDNGDVNIVFGGVSLHMAHCRSVLDGGGSHAQCNGSLVRLHHCEFRSGPGAWQALRFGVPGLKAVVEGCAFIAPSAPEPPAAFLLRYPEPTERSLEVRHNTFLNVPLLELAVSRKVVAAAAGRKGTALRLSDNLLATREIIDYRAYSGATRFLPSGEGLPLVPRLYDWKEERNAYANGTAFLVGRDDGKPSAVGSDIKTLKDWSRWWGVPESSSVQGDIRFVGPSPTEQDLDRMSPDQLRLAPGSVGKNADPSGRDLGADVDALGPGPAYEAWKKTADYQQWLKDCGAAVAQVATPPVPPGASGPSAVSATPLPPPDKGKPFVLVRKAGGQQAFRTFHGALAERQPGDAIEVHGNGPFPVPAAELDGRGLVLRAAPGYRPVFVARADGEVPRRWLLVPGGEMLIEGCDFHSDVAFPGAFLGYGAPPQPMAPCTLRNCRFWVNGSENVLACSGPHLLVENCLFVCAPRNKLFWVGPQVRLELTNNLVWLNRTLAIDAVYCNQPLRLTNNTFVGGPDSFLLLPPQAEAPAQPVTVIAEGNVFPDCGLLMGQNGRMPSEKVTRAQVSWQGRNNVYVRSRAAYVAFAEEKREVKSLNEWNQFWGHAEPGSVEFPQAEMAMQFNALRLLPSDAALRAVRQAAEPLLQRLGAAGRTAGPDWDLVGPGDAYVKALEKASGKPLPRESLRPEAVAGGPFVLLRNSETPRGYPTLQAAVDVWQDGDVIEVRTDGPAPGVWAKDPQRGGRLTVRAAPGYRPVVTLGMHLELPRAEVEVEGLALESGQVEGVYARLTLRNCALWNTKNPWNVGVALQGPGEAARFFRCVFSHGGGCKVGPGQTILLDNCVTESPGIDAYAEDAPGALVLRRSVFCSRPDYGALACPFSPKSRPRVASEDCLYVNGAVLTYSALGVRWTGQRNVYSLVGDYTYPSPPGQPIYTLEAWQKHNASDRDSLAVPPVLLDPQQWCLLPGQPKRPDGTDYGADVDKVTTPRVPPAAAPASVPAEPAHIEQTLGEPRLRHWNWVSGVAVSPDSKWIASAGKDGVGKVWDATTGEERYALHGHQGSVLCVAFQDQGNYVATGSSDTVAKLFDARTGAFVRNFFPMAGSVHTVVFRPDGKVLATMTPGRLRLYDVETGAERLTLDDPEGGLDNIGGGCAFSPQGQTLAYRSRKHGVRLCDATTGKERRAFAVRGKTVACVAWSPDGKTLAVGTTRPDPVVVILDAETGAERRVFTQQGANMDVLALAFRRDGKGLAASFCMRRFDAGAYGGLVRQWDLPTGSEGPSLPYSVANTGCLGVAFGPDGKWIVTGGMDNVVRVWDAASGRPRPVSAVLDNYLLAMALSPDGKTVAGGGYDGTIRLFNAAIGKEQQRLRGHRGTFQRLVFTHDGKQLISNAGGGDHTIRLWDVSTEQQLRQVNHLGMRLALQPGGYLVASAWWGKETPLRLWDTRTDSDGPRLDQAGLYFTGAAVFSPDGKTLATGHDTGVLLWDLATGQRRPLQLGPDQPPANVYLLAYSLDGKTLAAASYWSEGAVIRLWDVETARVRLTLPGRNGPVSALAFRPDGQALAVAGSSVRLWDPATGRPLGDLQIGPPFGMIRDATFTPDGRRLLTLNGDGTVSILRLSPPAAAP